MVKPTCGGCVFVVCHQRDNADHKVPGIEQNSFVFKWDKNISLLFFPFFLLYSCTVSFWKIYWCTLYLNQKFAQRFEIIGNSKSTLFENTNSFLFFFKQHITQKTRSALFLPIARYHGRIELVTSYAGMWMGNCTRYSNVEFTNKPRESFINRLYTTVLGKNDIQY